MLLSDIELRAEIDAERLVFEPALPDRALQSASIDLSLNRFFWRPIPREQREPEEAVDIGQAEAYRYLEKIEADEIEMEPGDFLLGETAEGMTIPQHLAGWIEGKSGLARHGLIVHCTAPHIAPGWGTPRPKPITLEIVNLGKVTVRLHAGIGISQLLVMRLGSPSLTQYKGKHLARGTNAAG